MINRKGFTFTETLITLTILTLVAVTVVNIFLMGTKAYRKEVENFTLIGQARLALSIMREDIRDGNSIILPINDGKESDKLIIVKHSIDFSKEPNTTLDNKYSPIYFSNKKIIWETVENIYGLTTEKEKNKNKKKYKDLVFLKRTEEIFDKDGNSEKKEKIYIKNIKKIAFVREVLDKKVLSEYVDPEEAGISSDNLNIELIIKSYREEDFNVDLGDIMETESGEKMGYTLKLTTNVNSRGSFLGGKYND